LYRRYKAQVIQPQIRCRLQTVTARPQIRPLPPLPLSSVLVSSAPPSASLSLPLQSQWAHPHPHAATPPQPPPLAISSVAPLPHAAPGSAPGAMGSMGNVGPDIDLNMVQAPKTTVNPTIRDRAYTYVMHLSVTRVRDICRASGLKQFGKKAESQPRLFWGADSLVDPNSETIESWINALPGFRDWLDAPHRDHATLWRQAPPRSSRPADYLTYFSHPSTGIRRSLPLAISTKDVTPSIPIHSPSPASVPAPAAAATGLMETAVSTMEDDVDSVVVSVGAGELPTERDRLYTYTRSLSITVVRRLCKRLGLKQFGRKRESQTRLFWHLSSEGYVPIMDEEGELDPKNDAIRWAQATTPERWFRAPNEIHRPTSLTSRIRDRSVQRRRKFAGHELARLVAALVSSPEMRNRTVAVLTAERRGGDEENAFWGACVAPLFNDQAFQPRISGSISREHNGASTGSEPRGGDELRRHFDRACPTFVRAYHRWHHDGAPVGKYELYLRERRRSDSGAPLSPTEKRAGIFFSVLKCGEETEMTDVLITIIENTDENEGKIEAMGIKTNREEMNMNNMNNIENNIESMKNEGELAAQVHAQGMQAEVDMRPDGHEEALQPLTTNEVPMEQHPGVDPSVNVGGQGGQPGTTYATTTPVVMEEEHDVSPEEELGPAVEHNHDAEHSTVVEGEGASLSMRQEEADTNEANEMMERPEFDPTMDGGHPGHSVGAGGLLGKRESEMSVEGLWAEVQQLRKRLEGENAASAKRRMSMERATQEKALNEAVISARKLKKELDDGEEGDDSNEKLKKFNQARIIRLTQEIEELSKEE